MKIATEAADIGLQVLLIRDVLGRFSLAIDDRDGSVPSEVVDRCRQAMADRLGIYAAPNSMVFATDLFDPGAVFGSLRVVAEPSFSTLGAGSLRRLENTVVGEGWTQVSESLPPRGTSRTALYGFKGGVGRSTATFMLAKHLADKGHCVLVVDLDLESPGIGPLLVSEEQLPCYGLIDYLVEAPLANVGDLDLVVRAPYIPPLANGEIWVAPARGRGTGDVPYEYVSKLNRIYLDVPGTEISSFADRLEHAVSACESTVGALSRQPDVVLLDSRAGIHDIAAVVISQLSDLALLFAIDSAQTWSGYQDLFVAWRSAGQAEAIRERLRVVASMVPDQRRGEYISAFTDHAWSCFSTLYDDLAADDLTGFNPSPQDVDAPHSPIPILFSTDLVALDAATQVEWSDSPLVTAAYHEFLETASNLIIEGV